MNAKWLSTLSAIRVAFREALVARGFADNGDKLFGSVDWVASDGRACRTAITIELGERFPVAPPIVCLDYERPGFDQIEVTFHLGTSGALCLYNDSTTLDDFNWLNPDDLISRIAGWCRRSEANWPGDNDCDLERYLLSAEHFVTYDSSKLDGATGTFAIRKKPPGITLVLDDVAPPPKIGSYPNSRRRLSLAWVGDLGIVTAPIRTWSDLETKLGVELKCVKNYIERGYLDLLLLRYQRGDASGVVAIRTKIESGCITLLSCESADSSMNTRILRAGEPAALLVNHSIAIVGCGAIGSFVADLLFRSGARKLTLIDPQKLRPGNVVRHVASTHDIGDFKVNAVLNHLITTGLPIENVQTRKDGIFTPSQAIELFDENSIVIDATADNRTTSLLEGAALAGNKLLISVCLQREGGISRVDRWPLRDREEHFQQVPNLGHVGTRESGCGEIVSLTPPFSVFTAANWAVRSVLDEISGAHALKPTLLEVLKAQPDAPYDQLGQVLFDENETSVA